ncbi:hypothetical protein ALC56_10122 [Trachymyrmex septentrionalis]|uniref:Uncharacterized protein n=1 Tax=Trachymyrmex septentrionalis TaxID=34720 RepID=A0A195F4Q6_9HYME|nr:hypothetical protein ALC56_10122 [Trachymyrmex septentrionalis]
MLSLKLFIFTYLFSKSIKYWRGKIARVKKEFPNVSECVSHSAGGSRAHPRSCSPPSRRNSSSSSSSSGSGSGSGSSSSIEMCTARAAHLFPSLLSSPLSFVRDGPQTDTRDPRANGE